MAVKGSYGLGKSYFGLLPYLNLCKQQGLTVVVVYEKRSLASKYSSEFGCVNYNDVDKKITNDFVVVQFNSLFRLGKP